MKMSGKVEGDNNRQAFNAFVFDRHSHNDWELYISSDRRRLIKSKIAEKCGMNRSAFKSNPGLIQMFKILHSTLRYEGILVCEDVLISSCCNRDESIKAVIKLADTLQNDLTSYKYWLVEIDYEIDKILGIV